MAKWGEGDDRWKVQELGTTGRNVNGWHWEESDVLPWAKRRLSELFPSTLVLLSGDGGLEVTADGKVSVSGEAVINRRKGKVIPAYELSVSFGWTGRSGSGEAAFGGTCKVPYVSEENHDEDPEVQFTVKEGGGEAEKVRAALVGAGRVVVWGVLRGFVRELRAGGPEGDGEGEGEGEEEKEKEKEKRGGRDGSNAQQQTAGAVAGSITSITSTTSTTSTTAKRKLEITETYYASSRDIYECFTDANKVRAYTASAATIEPVVGGRLSLFGGSIEGRFTELVPCERIVMDWRFSSWADGVMSTVVVVLEEKEKGSVTLRLEHAGVPEEDRFGNHDVLKVTEMGWRSQILTRMKQVFGYGM